jgi:hypothetical protein
MSLRMVELVHGLDLEHGKVHAQYSRKLHHKFILHILEPILIFLERMPLSPNPPNLEPIIPTTWDLDRIAELVDRLLLEKASPVIENGGRRNLTAPRGREVNQGRRWMAGIGRCFRRERR